MVKAPMTLGNGDAVGAQERELVALPFSSPFLSPLSPARKDRCYPEKSLPRCSPRQVDPRVSRPCSAAEPLLSAHARRETGARGDREQLVSAQQAGALPVAFILLRPQDSA